MRRTISERKFRSVSRRELLKLAPVLVLGAFAVPKLQDKFLANGLGFSDWASAEIFARAIWHPLLRTPSLPRSRNFPSTTMTWTIRAWISTTGR